MVLSWFFNKALSSREKKIATLVKDVFGKYPKNIELYTCALRHKSASRNIYNNSKESNERLEFLGDTILDSVVAEYLYDKYPEAEEGDLTKMKSRIVSRATLNKVAAKVGIGEHLETDMQAAHSKTSISGNALEALIGALYLDRGYVFAQKSTMNILSDNVNLKMLEDVEVDFKSRLYEEAHKIRAQLKFNTEFSEIRGAQRVYFSEVLIDDVPSGRGEGTSKKRAEQNAAEKALQKLNL